MAVTYKKPVDDELPWEQRLANYGQDTKSGLSEYQRAIGVYRSKLAAGDQAGADAANKWAGQVNTAIGGLGTQPSNDTRQALQMYLERQNKPQAQFNYDANTDPQYQAALAQAKSNVQRASGDIASEMNKRGIMNSTVTTDRGNQFAQQEYGNVSNNILPQLISQAYTRFRDQQNAEAAQNDNLLKYATYMNQLNQQDFDNGLATQDRARQSKLDNQAVSQWYTQTYGKQFDPKQDWGLLAQEAQGLTPQQMQEFMQSKAVQDAGLTGMYNGAPTMQKNAQDFSQWADKQQLNISQQNANTSAASSRNSMGNAQFNQLMDIWQATGKAPAGIPGVAEGTPLAEKNGSVAGVNMQEEIQGLMGSLRSGDLTPSTALQQLEEDFSVGHYTKPEYDQLKTVIAKLTPSYSKPVELTKEQQDAMPSDAQLDKMIPKGMPVIDWKSWYKDPRGRSAGLSFEQWQTLYGPSIVAKK